MRAGTHSGLTERLSAAPPAPDKPSIAVLPFENMSGDPEQEYFADGMVEEIITALCCDVVAVKVDDVAAGGYTADRATVRQKKTGRPVRFELSEQNRQAIDDYVKATNKRPGEFLFAGRRGPKTGITTRQYARLVSDWIGSVGLDPRLYGTHSLRRTKAALIYRRTGNLRAVQLLLGHTKIDYVPRRTMSRRAVTRVVVRVNG